MRLALNPHNILQWQCCSDTQGGRCNSKLPHKELKIKCADTWLGHNVACNNFTTTSYYNHICLVMEWSSR